ncbi:TPA: hypothetical protein ACGQLE_004295 [Escherichia coli]|nr:hypothetical protein [Escherichia coli]MCO0345960.1 hypothetical protein [Escherichia coli]MCO0505807.1 hypothetical protein [Escherichia coli]
MKRFTIPTIAVLILAGCATPEPLHKNTASSKPEGVYPGATVESVRNALMTRCNNGGAMTSVTENEVTCKKRLEGGGAIMTQVLIGNSYSTPPIAALHYTIGPQPDGVKVWADMWVETQMPGGQVNTMPANDNHTRNILQDGLDRLKIKKG